MEGNTFPTAIILLYSVPALVGAGLAWLARWRPEARWPFWTAVVLGLVFNGGNVLPLGGTLLWLVAFIGWRRPFRLSNSVSASSKLPKAGVIIGLAVIGLLVAGTVFDSVRNTSSSTTIGDVVDVSTDQVWAGLSREVSGLLLDKKRLSPRIELEPIRAVYQGYIVEDGAKRPVTLEYRLQKKCSWLETSETTFQMQQDDQIFQVDLLSSVEELLDHSRGREQSYTEIALVSDGTGELLVQEISIIAATKKDDVVQIEMEQPEQRTLLTNVPAKLTVEAYLYELEMFASGQYSFSYYALNIDSLPDTSTIEKVEITPLSDDPVPLFAWTTSSFRFDAEAEMLDAEYIAVRDSTGTELYAKIIEDETTIEIWLESYESLEPEACPD